MSETTFSFEFEAVEKCPLCRSVNRQVFHSMPIPVGGTANYALCTGCGLVYLDPAPTPASLNEFYATVYLSTEYRKAEGTTYPDPKNELVNSFSVMEHNVDFLEEFATPPGRLLDVGSSHGAFLLEAASRGWTAQGIEPFEEGVKFSSGFLKLDVRQGEFLEAEFEPESFDAVTMWEVIEHLRDPVAVMKKAAEITKPGGIILITSPNASSPAPALVRNQWIGWKPPTHLQFFDYMSVRRLLARTGWTPLRVKSGGGYIGRIVAVARKQG